jgi:hypothetical protein
MDLKTGTVRLRTRLVGIEVELGSETRSGK